MILSYKNADDVHVPCIFGLTLFPPALFSHSTQTIEARTYETPAGKASQAVY